MEARETEEVRMDPNQIIPVKLTAYEITVALAQLTKCWVEPASQAAIISVTDKMREALRGVVK